jgi:hypothetical protein
VKRIQPYFHVEVTSTRLDLYIEHGISADSKSKSGLDMFRKALLVTLLDGSPLLSELLIIGEREKTLEFGQIFEPNIFLNL